ncbi:hypothetical protein [Paraliobacillus ryukyuensis]|uniref:hypothetical protein n=1 Tax=Paraliobacillus ryukyuensis TaxID=200904 RepID=UPI0009A689C7|nr:hypothetical protein [Paraliobacillus ryukyuensis]
MLEQYKINMAKKYGAKLLKHVELFCFLISDDKDLMVYDDFHNTGNFPFDILHFQSYKREKSMTNKEDFSNKCRENEKLALEGLFQEPVEHIHIQLLNDLSITYEELFEKYLNRKSSSLLSILQLWDAPTKNNDYFLI